MLISGSAAALRVPAVPCSGGVIAASVSMKRRPETGAGIVVSVRMREALVSLGLTPQEAAEATRDIDADGREVDEMLREALQKVGR